jgi:hypothetical protein
MRQSGERFPPRNPASHARPGLAAGQQDRAVRKMQHGGAATRRKGQFAQFEPTVGHGVVRQHLAVKRKASSG